MSRVSSPTKIARNRRARRGRLVVVAASVSIAATTATAAADPTGTTAVPEGQAFYDAPAEAIAGPHGSVIRARSITGDPGLPGARNLLVLYRSVDLQGHPVSVSGTLAVPDGTPPPDGWPLISWAHGTTGVADICAPSRDTGPDYPAHDYTAQVREVQQHWLAAGYAVAQTDYQGLGTPGPHGYLIGTTEARAVADMALAARELDASIGTRWAAIGHSQGGQAAIFTDAQARAWAPGLDLRAVVALAPASQVEFGIGAQRVASTVGAGEALAALGNSNAFLPLLIRGAQTAENIDPARFLTPRASSLLPEADTGCIGALRAPDSWGGLPADAAFSPLGDAAPFIRVLTDNDPSTLRIDAPLLVLQGSADTTVPPRATDAMVARLRLADQQVTYRTYPGADHRGVLQASLPDALVWVGARFTS
ncbi:prolyl oligopeptidase family serine peptidase [Nocardia aobensis]|uniref:Prolyl oligopeptidase family serine peptidase n=1 Tax=Nocardia aobensis TaxID=257277 RepID=A0ABW6PDC3_9NOCA